MLRVTEPLGQVRLVVIQHPTRERRPAAEMCQVGAEDPAKAFHAPDRLAAAAAPLLHYTQRLGTRRRGQLDLLMSPGLEVGLRLRDDPEPHVGVGDPTVLLALAQVDARLVRLDRQMAGSPGLQVLGAGKTRHPEAVDDVLGRERDVYGAASRDVNLVGCDHAQRRVFDMPPPLVAGDGYLQDVARRLVSQREDRANGRYRDAGQQKGRKDRPPDLQPPVAVHLCGDLSPRLVPESHEGVGQQPLDQDEDTDGDPEDRLEEDVDLSRLGSLGGEGVLRAAAPAGGKHERKAGPRRHREPCLASSLHASLTRAFVGIGPCRTVAQHITTCHPPLERPVTGRG